jgi:hypothetical protein
VPNRSIGKQEGDTGPAGRELLDHLQVDLVGLAAATDVLAEGQSEQSGVPEHPEDLAREPLLALVLRRLGGELGVGQVAGQRDQVVRLGRGQFAVDRHGSPSSKTVLTTVPQYSESSRAPAGRAR